MPRLPRSTVTAGVVGGGDDGGIDGVYVVVGNRLLHENSRRGDLETSLSVTDEIIPGHER